MLLNLAGVGTPLPDHNVSLPCHKQATSEACAHYNVQVEVGVRTDIDTERSK